MTERARNTGNPPLTERPCDRCGQYVCTCTQGPSFFRQLVEEAVPDPMVPKGYMEIRDGDGKLLIRRRIGGDDA